MLGFELNNSIFLIVCIGAKRGKTRVSISLLVNLGTMGDGYKLLRTSFGLSLDYTDVNTNIGHQPNCL